MDSRHSPNRCWRIPLASVALALIGSGAGEVRRLARSADHRGQPAHTAIRQELGLTSPALA